MLSLRWLATLSGFFVFFCIAVSFSKERTYYNKEAHFSLCIPQNLTELTHEYLAQIDNELLNRDLLPSQVYYGKVRDYDVAFLGFDNVDTIEQRNTILGIEIERYEHFISFHKDSVSIFFDEEEVEAIRRRVTMKILAEQAKNIEERNLVIDEERFCYFFGLSYRLPDGSRAEGLWAGFLGKIHTVFLHFSILNPPEDLDCAALFTGIVNSFNFDTAYRYSKTYAIIRALGEALLIVILLIVMFFTLIRVGGLIERIFLGRQMEMPGGLREPLTTKGAMLKSDTGKTFDATVWVRVSEFFPSEITSVAEVEKSLEKLRKCLLEHIKKRKKIVPY